MNDYAKLDSVVEYMTGLCLIHSSLAMWRLKTAEVCRKPLSMIARSLRTPLAVMAAVLFMEKPIILDLEKVP